MPGRRFDIQLLRGIAVLAVVLFHASKIHFAKGFLGVDVFFVISGFLITGMILRGLEEGRFSFKHFYLRRAQRLLPASLTTLAVTTALAVVLLTPAEFGDYAKQLIGALTFSANFALSRQTGYFAGEAESKVLLHIWSLSLEEQFYFIAPLLLWVTPLRARPWLLLIGTVLSATVCFLLAGGVPIGGLTSKAAAKMAFFMLPPRAWELLVGSMAAWVMLRRPDIRVPGKLKYIAFVTICATCVIGWATPHPGPDALMVTVATAIVLLGDDRWLALNRVTSAVAKLGDWSYSVYLVHWPLFSFASIVYVGDPPLWILLGLLFLTALLGWLQYTCVEQPTLQGRLSAGRSLWAGLGAGTMSLALAAAAIGRSSDVDAGMKPQIGLDSKCDQRGATYVDKPACRVGSMPAVVLWGDSYAMHLVPGMRKLMGTNWEFVQVTKSACAPLVGIAQVGGNRSMAWAQECAGFNQSVVDALSRTPTVRDVLLASSWVQVLGSRNQELYVDGREQAWSQSIVREHLIRSIRALQAAGKRVILIGPTAIASYDVGECNARALTGRFLAGREQGCDPLLSDVQHRIGSVIGLLQSAAEATGAALLLPSAAMCNGARCQSVLEGKSLYRDSGHLTPYGSEYVLQRIGFRTTIDMDQTVIRSEP